MAQAPAQPKRTLSGTVTQADDTSFQLDSKIWIRYSKHALHNGVFPHPVQTGETITVHADPWTSGDGRTSYYVGSEADIERETSAPSPRRNGQAGPAPGGGARVAPDHLGGAAATAPAPASFDTKREQTIRRLAVLKAAATFAARNPSIETVEDLLDVADKLDRWAQGLAPLPDRNVHEDDDPGLPPWHDEALDEIPF